MRTSINVKTDFRVDKRILKFIWISLAILIIDQIIKVLVFNSLNLHQELRIIGNWFRIRLELNDGTAYGVPFKNEADRYIKISIKFFLSLVLMGCLIFFINKNSSRNLLIGLTLCFAGTVGNLIDRIFHGVILNNSLDKYNFELFHGRIVDMFYIPIIDTNLPNWIPIKGSERFIFFEPVFNLADLTLFVGGVISFLGLVKVYKTGKKI